MIKEFLLGTVTISAKGFDETKLIEMIRNSCNVISLYTKSDCVYIKTYAYSAKKLQKLCGNNDFITEIVERKGITFTLSKYIKRYGILLGLIISVLFTLYFSNVVMKIEITGTEDENIKLAVLEILEEEGIYTGKYIPSINFLRANLMLNTLCDDISWSSIAHTGSVVEVIVSELTPKEEIDSRRVPSNIIASRDGVIVKAEVLSGQLDVLIGDAVSKGELLVSGIIERRNGRVYYYHSFGEILAQYSHSTVITQSYEVTSKSYGNTIYKRALRFFDNDILLPSKSLQGNFDIKKDTAHLYFFGIKLPIGVSTYEYNEVKYTKDTLSTEEAFLEAYRLLDNYEKNIISNEEIISRSVEEVMNEDGVSLYVEYELIGEIGVQQEIFAK